MNKDGAVAGCRRSFDSVTCIKGDALGAQEDRMGFAKMHCELPLTSPRTFPGCDVGSAQPEKEQTT